MEEELVSEIGNEFLIDGPLNQTGPLIPNCLILLLQKWGLYILSAARSRMMKAIVFSRQNDSDSRACTTRYWENFILKSSSS